MASRTAGIAIAAALGLVLLPALAPPVEASHRTLLPSGLLSLPRFQIVVDERGTVTETTGVTGSSTFCSSHRETRNAHATWSWRGWFDVVPVIDAPYGEPNLYGEGVFTVDMSVDDDEHTSCRDPDVSWSDGSDCSLDGGHRVIPSDLRGRFDPATREIWFVVPDAGKAPFTEEDGGSGTCRHTSSDGGSYEGPFENWVIPSAWVGGSIAEQQAGRMNESFAKSAGAVPRSHDWRDAATPSRLAESGLVGVTLADGAYFGKPSKATWSSSSSHPAITNDLQGGVHQDPGAYVCPKAAEQPDGSADLNLGFATLSGSFEATGSCRSTGEVSLTIQAPLCDEFVELEKEHRAVLKAMLLPDWEPTQEQLVLRIKGFLSLAIADILGTQRASQILGCVGDDGTWPPEIFEAVDWVRKHFDRHIQSERGLEKWAFQSYLGFERQQQLLGIEGDSLLDKGRFVTDEPTGIVTFSVHSPVSLHLVDEAGGHVGWNAATNASETTIANTTYVGAPGGAQTITAPPGAYKVQVDGLADGVYLFEATWNVTGENGAATADGERWNLPAKRGESLALHYDFVDDGETPQALFGGARRGPTPSTLTFAPSRTAPGPVGDAVPTAAGGGSPATTGTGGGTAVDEAAATRSGGASPGSPLSPTALLVAGSLGLAAAGGAWIVLRRK